MRYISDTEKGETSIKAKPKDDVSKHLVLLDDMHSAQGDERDLY